MTNRIELLKKEKFKECPMAKIYIATTLSKRKDHNIIRDILVAQGHEITYDWTLHHSFDIEGFEYDLPEAQKVSMAERQGVMDADLLVVLLPGKKGTHIEIGMALAKNIPIVLHSEDLEEFSFKRNRCVFYFHPNVIQVTCSFDESEKIIEKIYQRLEKPVSVN